MVKYILNYAYLKVLTKAIIVVLHFCYEMFCESFNSTSHFLGHIKFEPHFKLNLYVFTLNET